MSGPNASPRSLLRNVVSQICGRLFLSVGRLGLALLIVHFGGAERYGEYALVISFITLFEWLVDFGQTDISVRDICQEPDREAAALRDLLAVKLAMGFSLAIVFPLLLAMLNYSREILLAGAVGACGLIFYSVLQVYRTLFRVHMMMERDVLAESLSLVVMLPLTWLACSMQAGLVPLVGAYALSRAVFLLLAIWLGRRELPADAIALRRASPPEMIALVRRAAPLGAAGLLVAVYDSLAIVALSKLADLSAVAQYAAATRFVYPVIVIVQSLNSAFYPPLAASWRAAPTRFALLQQSALTASVLVGGAMFAVIDAGAPFLMSLMGPQIGLAANVLRLMSWVVLARAVTTAMSPLIVIAGGQGKVLWITACAVVLQIVALIFLVPKYGLIGAVVALLAIEIALGVIPVCFIGQRVSGARPSYVPPGKLAACAIVAALAAGALPFAGELAAAIVAGLLYVGLALATKAILVGDVRDLIDGVVSGRPELPARSN